MCGWVLARARWAPSHVPQLHVAGHLGGEAHGARRVDDEDAVRVPIRRVRGRWRLQEVLHSGRRGNLLVGGVSGVPRPAEQAGEGALAVGLRRAHLRVGVYCGAARRAQNGIPRGRGYILAQGAQLEAQYVAVQSPVLRGSGAGGETRGPCRCPAATHRLFPGPEPEIRSLAEDASCTTAALAPGSWVLVPRGSRSATTHCRWWRRRRRCAAPVRLFRMEDWSRVAHKVLLQVSQGHVLQCVRGVRRPPGGRPGVCSLPGPRHRGVLRINEGRRKFHGLSSVQPCALREKVGQSSFMLGPGTVPPPPRCS